MAIFESTKVEERFRNVKKKYGIVHVLWASNHVVTDEDIDGIVRYVKGESSTRVTSEAFQEIP